MKVSVIGAGAIGLLVSYFLKMNQNEPVIYTRTAEQAKEINQSGITYIDKLGKKDTIFAEAKPVEDFNGSEEYCVVAVTQNAVKDLSFLSHQSYKNISIVFLQNGIGHIKLLEILPQFQICVGVVEHGAMKEGLTTVHHVGAGKIKISSFMGGSSSVWQSIFPDKHFPVVLESNWEEMLYEKLVMNASINPVTAILGIRNGILIENQHAQEIMKQLFKETISVLNLNQTEDDLWKELLTLCRNTSLNRSSMLKSVDEGKQTEIDAITGAIIDRAKIKNIEVPYSMFAYHTVKGLEWRG